MGMIPGAERYRSGPKAEPDNPLRLPACSKVRCEDIVETVLAAALHMLHGPGHCLGNGRKGDAAGQKGLDSDFVGGVQDGRLDPACRRA